jgi:hypothetical protein
VVCQSLPPEVSVCGPERSADGFAVSDSTPSVQRLGLCAVTRSTLSRLSVGVSQL